MNLLLSAGVSHHGQCVGVGKSVALVPEYRVIVLWRAGCGGATEGPLRLLHQVFDLGGWGTGTLALGLGRKTVTVVEVIDLVLLQGIVQERVTEGGAACVMGIGARGKEVHMV